MTLTLLNVLKGITTVLYFFCLPFDRSCQLSKLRQYSLIFVPHNAVSIHWFWMSDVKLNCQTLSDECSLSLKIRNTRCYCGHSFEKLRPIEGFEVFFLLRINWILGGYYLFCFWHDSPQWARAFSFLRFLDHTQRRTTVSRTLLDE